MQLVKNWLEVVSVSRISSNKCFIQLNMYIRIFDTNIYFNIFSTRWLTVCNYVCCFKPQRIY